MTNEPLRTDLKTAESAGESPENNGTEVHRPSVWRLASVGVLVAAVAAMAVIQPKGWAHVNDPVARFLIAITVVLAVCRLLGALLASIGQPAVVGEVIGGIALGPSLLGALWPEGTLWLFNPATTSAIGAAAQLGLAIFMFLLGCELRADGFARRPTAIGLVVIGGMGLPFIGGVLLAVVTGDQLSDPGRPGASVLFVGLALAITAMPVLARLLQDLQLERTPVGSLSLSAAAIGDGVAWLALALILATMQVGLGGQSAMAGIVAAGLLLVTLFWVRPLLAWAAARLAPDQGHVLVPVLVIAAVGYAGLSQLLGLHVVVGAFLFGVVMPRHTSMIDRLSGHLRGFTMTVLLPLFFVGVGLSASVGLIGASVEHLTIFAATLVIAVVTKVAGAGGGARLAGIGGRDSLRIGVLMNCRGVTELVVASIGYQAGLINQFGFTVLVLTALATTVVTAPLVRLLGRSEPGPAGMSRRRDT